MYLCIITDLLFFQEDVESMILSSKFGQKYTCNIPVLSLPSLNEEEIDEAIDPKSIIKVLDDSFGDSCMEIVRNFYFL